MKLMNKYCVAVLLFAVLAGAVLSLPIGALSGSATVKAEDADGHPLDGVEVHICKIADMDGTGYYLSDAFESSGMSLSAIVNLPNETNAKTVKNYAQEKGIPTLSFTTEKGAASFSGLDIGIWLVFCEAEGEYYFEPYFMFIPYTADGKLYYDVTSYPKVVENSASAVSVYVVKKWEDGGDSAGKRPDSVTVELFDGENAVASVILSAENGWSHTFAALPADGEYSVREQAVSDYTAQYSGDAENGFIITNSYDGEKLPQTGQLRWPVIILCIAGVGFIVLGIVELGAGKNEKKK